MNTRPDDSLFPQTTNTVHGGISLREHFAGLALQGLAGQFADSRTVLADQAADAAVRMADALIARLNARPAAIPPHVREDDPFRTSADDEGEMIDLALPATPASPIDSCF